MEKSENCEKTEKNCKIFGKVKKNFEEMSTSSGKISKKINFSYIRWKISKKINKI